MRRIAFVLVAVFASSLPFSVWAQDVAPVPADAAYKNAKLPAEERVKDLLSRMTLEEKGSSNGAALRWIPEGSCF